MTNEPLGSWDVDRIVTRGGALSEGFPFESTTEMKLGLASVDSGASVIVLVVVPVKDVSGPWATGAEGTGVEAWFVGLAGAAFAVEPWFPLDFTSPFV